MVSRGRILAVAMSLAACIIIASAMAFAASSPGVEWDKTYDIGGNDCGWSMQQTADGGFIMAGTSGSQVCLAKADRNGTEQWKNTYSIGDSAKGYSVRQATDGGYVVTGSARQGGKDKVLLMKAGQDGKQLWSKTYGDANAGGIEYGGRSVRQTGDGGYVIAAQYPYPTTNNCGLYLLRTDASGNLSQSVMVGKYGDVTSPSVEQTGDGGFIIAATIHTKGYQNSQPDYDIYLIKLDPAGATQWERTFDGAGSQYCGGDGSVKQTTDGGYIIAGENGGAYLVRTDAAGSPLWEKRYDNTARANSVALADDWGYVLAGTDGAGNLTIVKTSSTGDEEWRETGGPGEAATAQKTADGGYALVGTSGGDLCLLKLKAPVKESPVTDADKLQDDGPLSKNKSLFSGLNLFKFGPLGDSGTDLGQTSTGDDGLFGRPGMFSLFNDDMSAPVAKANSAPGFPSMPSFGSKNAISNASTGFPRIVASFGDSGWPFS